MRAICRALAFALTALLTVAWMKGWPVSATCLIGAVLGVAAAKGWDG